MKLGFVEFAFFDYIKSVSVKHNSFMLGFYYCQRFSNEIYKYYIYLLIVPLLFRDVPSPPTLKVLV